MKVCGERPETVLTDIAKHLHSFPIHDALCLRINVKGSSYAAVLVFLLSLRGKKQGKDVRGWKRGEQKCIKS